MRSTLEIDKITYVTAMFKQFGLRIIYRNISNEYVLKLFVSFIFNIEIFKEFSKYELTLGKNFLTTICIKISILYLIIKLSKKKNKKYKFL